jgi:hypothetical protein
MGSGGGLSVVCDCGGRYASPAHTLERETRGDGVARILPATAREKLAPNNTGSIGLTEIYW